MMQALIIILQRGRALCRPGDIVFAGVNDVACQHLLPEGETARGTYLCVSDGIELWL